MERYERLKEVRDRTLAFMIENDLTEFPVDVFALFEKLGCLAVPKSEISDYAITYEMRGGFVTVFNPNYSVEQLRFTMAHELGHIVLGHYEDAETSEYKETEANVFASGILVPIAVMRAERLYTVDRVANFFGVSETAAGISLSRMREQRANRIVSRSALDRVYLKLYDIKRLTGNVAQREPKASECGR